MNPRVLVGVAAGTLSAAAATVLIARRRRARQPDRVLDGFVAHRALRGELIRFARTLNGQRAIRSRWVADGEPVFDSDALQAANESVIARAFDLRDLAEGLAPLLEAERQRGRLIGPTTAAGLDRLADYLRRAQTILPATDADAIEAGR